MHVRRLTPEDAEEFRALRVRSLREHPEAFGADPEEDERRPREELARRLAEEPARSGHLGAFLDGRLVGTVVYVRSPRSKLRHKASLAAMYVVPEARGRGLGRALVAAALDALRQLGDVELVTLEVTTSQSAARALYRAAGFVPFGTEPGAMKVRGRSLDAEHMALRLPPGGDAERA